MEPLLRLDRLEQRRGFAGDEGQSCDLALAELVERRALIVVGRDCRDFEKAEQPSGRQTRSRTVLIDVYLLIRKIGKGLDLWPGKKMKLLIVKLSDVRERSLLAHGFHNVHLQHGQVDSMQTCEIDNVLLRALPDNREDAPRSSVIHNTGQILSDPHRPAGRSFRLDLDHPFCVGCFGT